MIGRRTVITATPNGEGREDAENYISTSEQCYTKESENRVEVFRLPVTKVWVQVA